MTPNKRKISKMTLSIIESQHNENQQNDTPNNGDQHDGTQHNKS